MNFLKELFMPNKNNDLKIGLCQFNAVNNTNETLKREISLKSKDIKLSDLMKRHWD